jgi:hypothetical protein
MPQAKPLLGLVNGRHPDARGLVIALPLSLWGRGTSTIKDASRHGGSGAGAFSFTGTPSYVQTPTGVGLQTAATGNYLTSANAVQLWAAAFGISCQFVPSATPAVVGSALVRANKGVLAMDNATNFLSLWPSGGGAAIATDTRALTIGKLYTVGVRYRASDNQVSFYINGERNDIAGAALAPAAESIEVFHGVFDARSALGTVRDVRIWNRYPPDETFLRAHYSAAAFYAPQRAGAKGVSANIFGRLFFPFLHPALQS